MKKEDLTCLKHIGVARMKMLNGCGIVTIKQLHETPVEKLAEIKSIGDFYAGLIKQSASEYYARENLRISEKFSRPQSGKPEKNSRELKRKIRKLKKKLNRVNENLKPLWKKKYLGLYVDFKKRFKKLEKRLNLLAKKHSTLSKKQKKKIIKKIDVLKTNLDKVRKKPKKKTYKKTTQEIAAFSRFIRDL